MLSGRDMKDGERFDFTLTPEKTHGKDIAGRCTIADNGDCAPYPGGKNGTKGFQLRRCEIYKEGTYIFNINETVPNSEAGGMTYDKHTTRAHIAVTDDTDHPGKLKASVTYNNGPLP